MFSVTTHSLQMITCQLVSTSSIGCYEVNVQEHECIQKLSTKVLNVQYRCTGCLVTDITSQAIWCTASNFLDANPTYKTNQPPSNNVDKTVSLKSNITGIPSYRSVHLTRYHS